jgi:hypothetical protein
MKMQRNTIDFGAANADEVSEVETQAITGPGAATTFPDGSTINLPAGTQGVTVTANSSTINAQAQVSFSLAGSNDTVELLTNDTATLLAGDQSEFVSAANSTINAQSNVSFTFAGTGNFINLAAGDTVTFSAGANTNTVNGSGDTFDPQSNVNFRLIGSNDILNLGANGAVASGTTVSLVSGDQNVTVNDSYNDGAIVVGMNVSFNLLGDGDNLNLNSDQLTLLQSDQNDTVTSSFTTIFAADAVSFNLIGGDDTVNLGAGSTVTFSTAANDDTVLGTDATIDAEAGLSTFTLTGNDNVVNLGHGDDNVLNIGFGDKGEVVIASGATINIQSSMTTTNGVEASTGTYTVKGIFGGVNTINVHDLTGGSSVGDTIIASDCTIDLLDAGSTTIVVGTDDEVIGPGAAIFINPSAPAAAAVGNTSTALLVQAMASFGAPQSAASPSFAPASAQPQHPVIAASLH